MKDYFNAIPIASEHTDFLLKDFLLDFTLMNLQNRT